MFTFELSEQVVTKVSKLIRSGRPVKFHPMGKGLFPGGPTPFGVTTPEGMVPSITVTQGNSSFTALAFMEVLRVEGAEPWAAGVTVRGSR